MSDRNPTPPKDPARAAREKRLAEALRVNLRRRKGAAKSKASDTGGGSEGGRGPESASKSRGSTGDSG